MSVISQPTATGNDVARWERGKRIPRIPARRTLEQVLDLPKLVLDRAAAVQRALRGKHSGAVASTTGDDEGSQMLGEQGREAWPSRGALECCASNAHRFDIAMVERRVELDFADGNGTLVRQVKTARIRAESTDVRGYVDHMSADGQIRGIVVHPGSFAHKRTEGGEMFLTVEFPRALDKGKRRISA